MQPRSDILGYASASHCSFSCHRWKARNLLGYNLLFVFSFLSKLYDTVVYTHVYNIHLANVPCGLEDLRGTKRKSVKNGRRKKTNIRKKTIRRGGKRWLRRRRQTDRQKENKKEGKFVFFNPCCSLSLITPSKQHLKQRPYLCIHNAPSYTFRHVQQLFKTCKVHSEPQHHIIVRLFCSLLSS